MKSNNENELFHYGTPRHSGRYPWGSGEDPYQRSANFLSRVHLLKNQGVSEVDIAKGMGMTTTELRKRISLSNAQKKAEDTSMAVQLHEKGWSNVAIGKRMGLNESSVRLLLDPVMQEKRKQTSINADILKEAVADKQYIDVGSGTEQLMGITRHNLDKAVSMLQEEGYSVNKVKVEQLGTGKETEIKVLSAPGTEWKDVMKNQDKISLVDDRYYSVDGGKTSNKLEPPRSVDSDRVAIVYKEDGGDQRDGLVELRRGVDDISLGNARYAQVRIAVDGTHYIKGMAVYSDDLPDGVDIRFNTNKSVALSKMEVLKEMKKDPDNPFGATIRDDRPDAANPLVKAQRHYIDKDGNEQLSALNIVSEEGTWSGWSKNLASQMLSKQPPALAKQQLDLSFSIAKDEFNEIMSLTNPTLKAKLLEEFAGKCDSDAVHLQAAALPRQSTRVILPFPNLKENQIYAPGYRDGEEVALVRYPHGGIFEIPVLTVNNKFQEGKKTIGEATDAVGIHYKAAERLSGADFDGDTVVVIPVDKVKIRTSAPLKGLVNFDPKQSYPGYEGMHVMTKHEKGLEMGKISNLITDMTIKGATPDELARAVRHSMVVIDAEKHKLNYKLSEENNNIAELVRKYQQKPNGEAGGASTLISRSTSETRVNARKEKALSKMTPEEKERYFKGEVVYEETGRTYSKPVKSRQDGSTIGYVKMPKQEKSTKMAETPDAFSLISSERTPIEVVYATYANQMKALANEARKNARIQQEIKMNPNAKDTYAKEYASLKAKLNLAQRNAPLERQAQLFANDEIRRKKREDPTLVKDYERLKRLKGQALDAARKRFGAKKSAVTFTEREWEAVNAGAISKTMLRSLLDNADMTSVRRLAMPKTTSGLSSAKVARAKSMLSRGYSQADVADQLGISVSTLMRAVEGENT